MPGKDPSGKECNLIHTRQNDKGREPRAPPNYCFLPGSVLFHTHRLIHRILHGHILNADAKGKRMGRIGNAIFEAQMNILNF